MISGLRRLRVVRLVARTLGLARLSLLVAMLRRPWLALAGGLLRGRRRDDRQVVLGAPLDRFADNAAYLFLHLSTAPGPLRPVWITGSVPLRDRLRRLGYDARLRWSLGGLRACLRAGTFVYSGYRSDINVWLAAGARAVCLWHGLPIKRVERGLLPVGADGWRGSIKAWSLEPPPDVLLSSTPRISRDFMAPAFGVRPEQCWDLGYPRTDHLAIDPGQEPAAGLLADVTFWRRLRAQPRVVGLFLTWRDARTSDIADEALVTRLANICAHHGATLAYKAHFNVAAAAVEDEHCMVLPTDDDLNAYLGLCDVLITDYSSTALDFLVTGRPTLYYTPDLEEYERTRGFYLDPRTLPGGLTTDADELAGRLDQLLSGATPPDSHAIAATALDVWGDTPGRACQRIADRLVEGSPAIGAAAG